MEQLINNMLTMQVPKTVPAGKKSEPASKDGFQKLMEEKQGAADSAPQKKEQADAAQKPQDSQGAGEAAETANPREVEVVSKDYKSWEERMVLAALEVMGPPTETVEYLGWTLTPADDGTIVAGPNMTNEDMPLQVVSLEGWDMETTAAEVNGTQIPWAPVTEETAEETPELLDPATELIQETKAPEVEIKVETGDVSQESEEEDTPAFEDAQMEAPLFEDVKAVPVKVGEAPKAETPKPVEEQIAPKVSQALANGETRVELELTPENLGKVTVEMTWSKDGGLVVQIHAENRETQNLLNKNMSGLESLLSRETQQEVRVEVPRQEESQRQDLYEQQQEHHRQRQQEEHRQSQEHSGDSEAFMQQLRLGLIPMDGE